ncbi:hypothetical protein [Pseudomonas sp. BF-RE-29]|uniref:hypothetical protein n=1 Tax=Pseudomonas sp. BF-RE-29 TaxID=2832378 RepID=UPI0029587A0E|nr:hypothetical protein [Pseudomonas sp. BF-RE-29]
MDSIAYAAEGLYAHDISPGHPAISMHSHAVVRVAHNDHIATGVALAPLLWPKGASAAFVCIQRHGPLDEKPVSLIWDGDL